MSKKRFKDPKADVVIVADDPKGYTVRNMVSDTLYKRNGKEISKLDFEKFNKENDSIWNRMKQVDEVFPMEKSSFEDAMMSSRLKKDIAKGFHKGTFTSETNGKILTKRTLR